MVMCFGERDWWPRNSSPRFSSHISSTSWKMAWPKILTHILGENKLASRDSGMRFNSTSSTGFSVASAKAAKVSMIKFNQSSCTGVSGLSFDASKAAPMKVINTPTILTVTWNWRNFLMLSFTLRPHITALTTLRKLSSSSTISEADLATSVPVCMENPTSAIFNAGPSFVPSPVTATTMPASCSSSAKVCLSSGLERASTCNLSTMFLKALDST
mmetsp:Transcript_62663/g.103354  ORF Transcript_62663/g.103354 Transcript_62663/m.103354 type:complete len:215 (+) Transcript_62663:2008-2652(+)